MVGGVGKYEWKELEKEEGKMKREKEKLDSWDIFLIISTTA